MRHTRFHTLVLLIAGFSLGVSLLTSCSSPRPVITPEQPFAYDADRKAVEEMPGQGPSLVWQTIDRTVFMQAEHALDFRRGFGSFWGKGIQSANINRYDEVPNSSWFTNRHGLNRMSLEAIKRGRIGTGGPDTTAPWQVFRPKVGGATPGFWIEDARGDQYILKFDPRGNPEMATAAAAMGSRYFHACGYNTPEEMIVYWHPDQLTIREGATINNSDGSKRPFTQADLDSILALVEQDESGRVRSLASLSLGKFGKIKGPFAYDGTYDEDPNDWCPHQHRRELRALYVIGSFINHYDMKDQNTMNIFVETEPDRGYLEHYLLDFGSTFGSDGQYPKHPRKGYANMFDLKDVMINLVTLGLKKWYWEDWQPSPYPEVGYFESDLFHPGKFDPIVPNPAFELRTDRDAYWGAKIVMAWRDDDIRALVETAEYSRPEVSQYMVDRLIERRDKIGRYWFAKVNPLDNFTVTPGDSGMTVDFEDLWVTYQLDDDTTAVYKYELKYRGKRLAEGQGEKTVIQLDSGTLASMTAAYKPDENDTESNLYTLDIRTARGDDKWSHPVRVWLWYFADTNSFDFVGLEHLD